MTERKHSLWIAHLETSGSVLHLVDGLPRPGRLLDMDSIGIYWFEKLPDGRGRLSFVPHRQVKEIEHVKEQKEWKS